MFVYKKQFQNTQISMTSCIPFFVSKAVKKRSDQKKFKIVAVICRKLFFFSPFLCFAHTLWLGLFTLVQWPAPQLRFHSWVACPERLVGFRTRDHMLAAKERKIGSGHNFSCLVSSRPILNSFLSGLVLSCAVHSSRVLSCLAFCVLIMLCVVLYCCSSCHALSSISLFRSLCFPHLLFLFP